MEKLTTAQEDRLLNYLDGTLGPNEVLQLKKELEHSPALYARLEELRVVHRVLAATKLESPSPAFATKVMKNLHIVSFSSGLSPRNGMLLVAGMMVAAGILVTLVSAGVFDKLNALIPLDQVVPIKKYLQQSLPVMSINVKLIMNILIGLNLVLAFLVLDKTVLRPFFQRRSGTQL